MKMKRFFLVFALLFAFLIQPVFAVTVEEVAGTFTPASVSVKVGFLEPSFEWDSITGLPTTVPLTDLHQHYIWWRVTANGDIPGNWNQVVIPASSVNGGMSQLEQIDGVSLVGGSNFIEAYVESLDTSFNKSPVSPTVDLTITVDIIPPAPPE